MKTGKTGTRDLEATREREPIRTRETRWQIVLLFLAVSSAFLVLIPLVRDREPFAAVLGGRIWWENLNLFLILLVFCVGGVVFGLGRLRPREVGLEPRKLLEGIIVTAAAWALMQAWPYVASGTATVHQSWDTVGAWPIVRWALVMFLVTALYEEVAFRGFLYPQLYLKLNGSHRARLVAAAIVSQLLFAASHIPAHIMVRDMSGMPLLRVVALQGLAGMMLLALYLRTRNLWIAIGIHGLANAPTSLYPGALQWEMVLIPLVLVWPWLTRRPYHRGFARVESVRDSTTA